ncbi:hypothetical protein PanWU01x14_325930 [Parasponia andersonii]|uniref:Uncharacterized protein n=1 Tax=Parasponia andersonii TaxID=3476 RepID=A0A2P5AJL0_PARAD|nr:hypothetical protein PanWU01x14_325930 [Parasponia andersonii]
MTLNTQIQLAPLKTFHQGGVVSGSSKYLTKLKSSYGSHARTTSQQTIILPLDGYQSVINVYSNCGGNYVLCLPSLLSPQSYMALQPVTTKA